MNIIFYEVKPEEKQAYQQEFGKENCTFFDYPLNENTAPQNNNAEIISIFVCSSITKNVLKNFPKLQLIITRSTGTDQIDLKATKKSAITVRNLPDYAQITVAEFTFALILMLSRKLKQTIKNISDLNYSTESLRGFDLYSKTIGIIGMGNIGKHVAQIARGFSMNIIAYDVNQDPECAQEFDFCYVELKKLLSKADIITLHVPLNPDTKHLINLENIGHIKKGALLINTARGEIVQTKALVQALQQHIISGAGLDVLENECKTQNITETITKKASEDALNIVLCNCWLAQQPNVIITPHTAFNSSDALHRSIKKTIEIINHFKNLLR